jgi:hypothetical protein
MVQETFTSPVSFERAPYLLALVISSCSAIVSARATFGATWTGVPSSRRRPPPFPKKALSARPIISRKSAPFHLCSIRTSWAWASAINRPSNVARAAGATSLARNVWAVIA